MSALQSYGSHELTSIATLGHLISGSGYQLYSYDNELKGVDVLPVVRAARRVNDKVDVTALNITLSGIGRRRGGVAGGD